MSEKQAKAAFLKQAKPFLKRYETESKRKNTFRRSRAKTTHFKAAIETAGAVPVFAAEFHDVMFGPTWMRVPILFTLPPGFEAGRKFTDTADFANFKKYCEGK